MPKRYLLPFVPPAGFLLLGLAGLVAGPPARTQAYFGLQREWSAHWPFEHGRYFPRIVQPALQPFVPVWLQVEPRVRMQLDPEDYVSREILETGSWESSSWKDIQEHLQPGATFVDV